MPNPIGVGFFGKLPSAGDFVQRRLPPSFVEVWDRHFEQAVDASRRALGDGWQHAYRSSPVWRLLLPPGVCTASAWVGIMGPASDRVGRSFPMVIATPWDDPSSARQILRQGERWFAAIERVYADAQSDPSVGVEAFDARLVALADEPIVAVSTDPSGNLQRIDWHSYDQWRLPLPRMQTDGALLSDLWACASAAGDNCCLWWTRGAGHVPASVLVTRGLPQASAYAGFLDASHADEAWQSLGMFDEVTPHMHATQQRAAHVSVAAHVTLTPATPAPRKLLPDDMSELLADLVPPVSMAPATGPSSDHDDVEQGGHVAVVFRNDASLALVAANEGAHDPRRQAATAAGEVASNLSARDLVAGMQTLRERLLALHPRLRQSSNDLINPLAEDGSVIAVHITGRWANLLRIGTAAAWHWRNGKLQSLFATGTAVPTNESPALAGELDDLLFTRSAPVASGLGGPIDPLCDEVVFAVEAGDRLLLVATHEMVQLSPDVYTQAVAMPSCDEARARIATAAGLGPESARWPLAVIEVTS